MLKSTVLCGISEEENGEIIVQGVFILAQNGDEKLPEGFHLKEVFMVERYHVGPKDPPRFGQPVWEPIDMQRQSIWVVCEDGRNHPTRFAPWDYGLGGRHPLIGLKDFNPYRVRETRRIANAFIREVLGQLS